MSAGAVTSVLVTSDTHVSDAAKLPTALLALAERADHVLHAGDLVVAEVLDVLAAFAPLHAVLGNCDGGDAAARIPEQLEVEIAGVRFGMVHDGGQAEGRHARLRERFPSADVVVYGHSHMPEVERAEDGLLVLNPGSPVQKRRAPFHSVIWLELRDGAVGEASLIDLDEA